MRISTIGYVGKQGVKNIGRNKMFSAASIATMSACIFLDHHELSVYYQVRGRGRCDHGPF